MESKSFNIIEIFIFGICSVGSGKSSFFHALIGDMKFDEDRKPELNIQGEVSYVPQKPWILNGTVKDNIIFNEDFDEKRYQEAIKYSCLERDISILSNGDKTMIGMFFFLSNQ